MPEQANAVYTPAFFDDLAQDTKESADAVVPVVNELLQPTSVLDVGCGMGTWLAEWNRVGVPDLFGRVLPILKSVLPGGRRARCVRARGRGLPRRRGGSGLP